MRFIRHNAKKFGINPDRIGGMGYSSGGHLVSLLGVLDGKGANEDRDPVYRESGKIQAVVAGGYPSDLTVSVTPLGQPFVTSFMGMAINPWLPQASTESKKYQEASPIGYISADDAPHFLFHGDADEVVPFKHAQLMDEALQKAGVPVKLLRIPGGTHVNLRTKDSRLSGGNGSVV